MTHLRICHVLLLLSAATSAFAGETEVLDIGARRELFVDYTLIERLEGASLELHRPRHVGKSLDYDKPWEGAYAGAVAILDDGDLLRAYYRGYRTDLPGAIVDGKKELTCYAESRDGGRSWIKPELGLHEVHGATRNNVLFADSGGVSHNFAPFIDNRPGVSEAERYKAIAGTKQTGGVHGFVSSDAIHWKPVKDAPLITKGAFDSQNIAFWSPSEQCYVCYFRIFREVPGTKPADGDRWRWIARSTSPDFRAWSDPVEMQMLDGRGKERPPEHYYLPWTMPYYRAPHIYLSFPKRFTPFRSPVALEEGKEFLAAGSLDHYALHSSDSIFMTSRGGEHYDRIFMEAFIRPGPDPRDWITRANSCAYAIVPNGEREISVFRYTHYAQPTNHLARYTLRVDGFVSVNAPYEGGELITKPLKFTGNQLELNFETSAAGGIRVEIQNPDGSPIPGFTAEECNEAIGDKIKHLVSWKNGGDPSALSGQAVRLRFVMYDADLYSMRFSNDEAAADK